jgi:hypothetical protein
MLGRAAIEPLPGALEARLGPPVIHIGECLSDHLRRSAEALSARREAPPLEAAEAAFDDCARTIAALRDEGLTLALPVDAAERLFTLGFALEQMRRDLRDLDRCVSNAASRR